MGQAMGQSHERLSVVQGLGAVLSALGVTGVGDFNKVNLDAEG